MATAKKVLLLTNFFGLYSIVPIGNEAYYQRHNLENPDKPYKWKEMEADEAMEIVEKSEGGKDPSFVSSKDAIKIATDNAAKLKELTQTTQAKDDEIAKLNEELAALKAAQTAKPPAPSK